MDALSRPPKELDRNSCKFQFHAEHRTNPYKTLNPSSCLHSKQDHIGKSSPHFATGKENVKCRFEREKSAPDGIGKVRGHVTTKHSDANKSGTMLHSRVISGITKDNELVSTSMLVDRVEAAREALANESFTCGELKRRELRSYSQLSKCGQRTRARDPAKRAEGVCNKTMIARPKLVYPADSTVASGEETAKEKIAVTVNLAESAKLGSGRGMKGVVVTTNGSYINNININPVAYTTQHVAAADSLSKRKNTERRDSECVEIASKLELELKKTVRESERVSTSGHNKFAIYRTFFDEIIKADPYFGGMLREIQKTYESKIVELNALLAKQGDSYDAKQAELRKELEREHRLREDNEKQRLLVLKEMKKQAVCIETQKTVIAELKSQAGTEKKAASPVEKTKEEPAVRYRTLPAHKLSGSKRDQVPRLKFPGNSSTRHAAAEKQANASMMVESRHVVVPRLDLSRIHSKLPEEDSNSVAQQQPMVAQNAEELKESPSGGSTEKNPCETEVYVEAEGIEHGEDGPLDYHDEFMSKADEFSQSWKNALAREKRY